MAEYILECSRSNTYQSETEFERGFIRLLTAQGYEHLTLHDEAALIDNQSKQLQILNNHVFSDRK